MIDSMIEDHRRIAASADALETQLGDRPPRDLTCLARTRWTLTREVIQHIAVEDSLLHDAGPVSVAKAAALRRDGQLTPAEFGGMFRDHANLWARTDIDEHWQEFCRDTRKMLTALRDRMLYEETRIYPALRQAFASGPTPEPGPIRSPAAAAQPPARAARLLGY